MRLGQNQTLINSLSCYHYFFCCNIISIRPNLCNNRYRTKRYVQEWTGTDITCDGGIEVPAVDVSLTNAEFDELC